MKKNFFKKFVFSRKKSSVAKLAEEQIVKMGSLQQEFILMSQAR